LSKGATNQSFFYLGQSMLSNGSAQFLDGAGLDEHLQLKAGTLNADYLTDHLGSTAQLIDSANGQAKARLDYASYGALEADDRNPLTANPYTYTGREDDGTGLMYYRARYYDPELEVFISQDPLGDAQRYAEENPIKFIDPLGLKVDLDLIPGSTISSKAQSYSLPNGYYSVLVHAGADPITHEEGVSIAHKFVSVSTLAEMIRKNNYSAGTPILLLSCSTASTGVAQRLANILNVPVKAPTELLWWPGNNRVYVKPSKIIPEDPVNHIKAHRVPDFSGSGIFTTIYPKGN
jgi:RHS repeat-associated protein